MRLRFVKYSIVLQFIFSSFNLLAQDSLLTVGEVYDFEIGDIFQYEYHYYGSNPPEGEIYEILNKWYSVNMETINYARKITHYLWKYAALPEPHAYYALTYAYDTLSKSYLDSYFSLTDSLDHYYHGYCDSLCVSYRYVYNPSFEPSGGQDDYSKGLGQVYHEEFDWSEPYYFFSKTLNYYKKSGVECNAQNYVLGIESNKSVESPNLLFPNPTNGLFSITVDKPIHSLLVFDISGKVVSSVNFNQQNLLNYQVNITNQVEGVYFVLISHKDGTYSFNKVVKQ